MSDKVNALIQEARDLRAQSSKALQVAAILDRHAKSARNESNVLMEAARVAMLRAEEVARLEAVQAVLAP